MSQWSDRVHFLMEEETAPPEQPDVGPEAASGVPRSLRRGTRLALIAVAATSLMAQVIGIRLVAPVDASPSYVAQCILQNCKGLKGQARIVCVQQCQNEKRNQP
jgi:hypothetical protein